MGKSKQKELKLRQVNIQTESVSAVSEFMNTTDMSLANIEDNYANVESPIMKTVRSIPALATDPPEEDEVIKGHEEVGMKLSHNSFKHPKRVERAREKRERQLDLINKKSDFVNQQLTAPEMSDELKAHRRRNVFRLINKMDLGTLMYDKKGATSYDKLFDNYDEIKGALERIPEYEQELNERIGRYGNTAELLESKARLKTLYDIRGFYDVIEKIMMNKYYSLLPHKEMHALSFNELRKRLAELYDAQGQRNQELIDYYQNLIRLKEIGLSDGKSVNMRLDEYREAVKEKKPKEEKRDPKELLEAITNVYSEMVKHEDKDKNILTVSTGKVYKQRFFETFAKDIDYCEKTADKTKKGIKLLFEEYESYKQGKFAGRTDTLREIIVKELPQNENAITRKDKNADQIQFTDEQKEGIRRVQGYLLGRGIHKGKFAFINNLLEAPLEQQMLVFYLVENGMEEGASLSQCYTALYNYVPTIQSFRKKKLNQFSKAMRTSLMAVPAMDKLIELETAIQKTDKQVKDDQDPQLNQNRTDDQKKVEIAKLVMEKGTLLRFLYRNAGMHEDMPPDMAADPVLRQRLFKEYREIAGLLETLQKMNQDVEIKKDDYEKHDIQKKRAAAQEDEKSHTTEKVTEVVGKVNEYVLGEGVGVLGNGINSLGGYSKSLTVSSGFGFVSSGIGGVTALLGAVGVVLTTIQLAKDDTLSGADAFAQWTDLVGDGFNVVGGTVSAVATLGSAITNLGSSAAETASEGVKWLGNASEALWATGEVADKVALVGGGICAVAGTIKLGASVVQGVRSASTALDISRSRDTLKTKDPAKLTPDEKLVKQFLDRQKFEANRSGITAGIGMLTGIMAVAGGVLAMTGTLAPVGAVIGVAAIGIEIVTKVVSHNAKKANQMNTVDRFLNLDEAVKKVIDAHPEKSVIEKYDKSKLKDMVRQELLGAMGFSSYKTCYKYVCTKFAEVMYRKVFTEKPAPDDRDMYLNAMKSLGMKIREPKVQGDEPKPSIDDMVSRLMG